MHTWVLHPRQQSPSHDCDERKCHFELQIIGFVLLTHGNISWLVWSWSTYGNNLISANIDVVFADCRYWQNPQKWFQVRYVRVYMYKPEQACCMLDLTVECVLFIAETAFIWPSSMCLADSVVVYSLGVCLNTPTKPF